jgi:hypothetical protein
MMPCSMDIDDYSILFFVNVDIDILVFLEIFPCNEVSILFPIRWFPFILHMHFIYLIF